MKPLGFGSTGLEVKNLQYALNYHFPLLPPLTLDSQFGPITQGRVTLFQQTYSIPYPHGGVGPRTHGALYTFVELKHHVLFVDSSGDDDPGPSILPALPLLKLTFPEPFQLPPLVADRLEIDPRLLLLFRKTKFELESGQDKNFHKTLGTGEKERELSLFSDLKAVVWSKPILGDHLEFSAGPGFILEKKIHSPDHAEASAYIFGKAEIHDVLKLGPLDLAKLSIEGQVVHKFGTSGPPDMSATLKFGPEVEAIHDRLTFGPSVYLDIKSENKAWKIGPGVQLSGTYHF